MLFIIMALLCLVVVTIGIILWHIVNIKSSITLVKAVLAREQVQEVARDHRQEQAEDREALDHEDIEAVFMRREAKAYSDTYWYSTHGHNGHKHRGRHNVKRWTRNKP